MEKQKSPYFLVKYCNPSVVSTLRVVHYKSDVFDINKFQPITNEPMADWVVKPKGGLWTSPVDSEHSWTHFCHSEQFNVSSFNKKFILGFYQSAKIAVINSYRDLERLPMRGTPNRFSPVDWEFLSNYADAFWLTEQGEYTTRLSAPHSLYGWDCETVLIMNPRCCYQLRK